MHRAAVERLVASYRAIPRDAPVRLAKKTSNLFRARDRPDAPPAWTSRGSTASSSVDPEAAPPTCRACAPTSTSSTATLPARPGAAGRPAAEDHHPRRRGHRARHRVDVVPQRPAPRVRRSRWTSSPGRGEIVTARPEGEHADLFHGFPNSYGTLGYATRLRIELEPVEPLRRAAARALPRPRGARRARSGAIVVDTVSTTASGWTTSTAWCSRATESYLTLGRQSAEPGPVSDYTGHVRSTTARSSTTATPRSATGSPSTTTSGAGTPTGSGAAGPSAPRTRGCAGCGRGAGGAAAFYWKLIALDHRFDVADRLEARKGRPPRERVVQDVEVPLGRTAEFVHWFLREVPIEPIWLCPVRSAASSRGRSTRCAPGETYVNVGFWSSVPARPRRPGRGQPPHRAARSPRSTATSPCTPTPSTTRPSSGRLYGGDAYAASQGPLRPRCPAARPLLQGGATQVTDPQDNRPDTTPRPPSGCRMAEILDVRHRRGRCRCASPPTTAAPPARTTRRAACTCRAPRGASYLATAPGDLGMARAYVAGDLDLVGRPPRRPLPAARGHGRRALPGAAAADRCRQSPARSASSCSSPPPPPPQEALPRWRRVAEGLRHSQDPRRRGDPATTTTCPTRSTSRSSARR